MAHNLTLALGSTGHEEAAVASRKEYFKKVAQAVEYEHESAVERKKMIEKRKEGKSQSHTTSFPQKFLFLSILVAAFLTATYNIKHCYHFLKFLSSHLLPLIVIIPLSHLFSL